jgi:hypothetical protein
MANDISRKQWINQFIAYQEKIRGMNKVYVLLFSVDSVEACSSKQKVLTNPFVQKEWQSWNKIILLNKKITNPLWKLFQIEP